MGSHPSGLSASRIKLSDHHSTYAARDQAAPVAACCHAGRLRWNAAHHSLAGKPCAAVVDSSSDFSSGLRFMIVSVCAVRGSAHGILL